MGFKSRKLYQIACDASFASLRPDDLAESGNVAEVLAIKDLPPQHLTMRVVGSEWRSAGATEVGGPGEHVADDCGQHHADDNQTGDGSGVVGGHGISQDQFG